MRKFRLTEEFLLKSMRIFLELIDKVYKLKINFNLKNSTER